MSSTLQHLLAALSWLQAPGTAPVSAPAAAAEAAGGGDPTMACGMQAGFFVLILVVMYFFMIRPENKRREEHESLLKSLRPGQKIRTSSGLLAEIISIDATEAVISLGQKEKVRVNIQRSHIAGLAEPPKDEAAKSDKKAGAKAADED